jgi:hypothetical protein
MKIIEVIGEILLSENVNQAEKLLKTYNIPFDNPEYIEFKNTLLKNNNIGYLGPLINMAQVNKELMNDSTLFKVLNTVYRLMLENKNLLNNLPKKIHEYTSIYVLIVDINELERKSVLKKFTNLLVDKNLKFEINSLGGDGSSNWKTGFYDDIIYYFKNIDKTPQSKMFTKKINKYNDINDIFDFLNTIVTFHKKGFFYEKYVKKGNGKNIKLVYRDDENERLLFIVTDSEGIREIGSPSWCINGEDAFKDYNRDDKIQYVFLDFTSPDIKYSVIGFTMDVNNEVSASHLLDDTHVNDITSYLKQIGVLYKFTSINKEIIIIKKNNEKYFKLKSNNYNDEQNYMVYYQNILSFLNIDDDGSYDLFSVINYGEDSMGYSLPCVDAKGNPIVKRLSDYDDEKDRYFVRIDSIKKIFISFINKDLLKIKTINLFINKLNYILDIFKEFKIPIIKNNTDHYDDYDNPIFRFSHFITVNLFDNDDLLTINESSDKDLINTSLIKVFTRYVNLDEITYNWFIKKLMVLNPKEKVFEIIKQRKNKTSEEYTPVEFHNIKNTTNLKSKLFNKIQKSRREGVIDLTSQEVTYGVQNGLKLPLVNLYKQLLPYFSENELNYEHATIYKILGMEKDIFEVIKNKKVYTSLNSIEQSIYYINNVRYDVTK